MIVGEMERGRVWGDERKKVRKEERERERGGN